MRDSELQAIFDDLVETVGDDGVPIVLNLDSDKTFYSPPKPHLAGSSARFDIPRVVGAPRDPKVVEAGGVEAFAGTVREFLWFHRVLHQARATYALTMVVHDVLSKNYGGAGKGGGVIYNAPPMIRAAHAASADFVTRTYGPQTGYLGHPIYGLLFRVERDVTDDVAELTAPTLVYAAVWRDDMEDRAQNLAGLLSDLDPKGAEWWSKLKGSATFSTLSDAVQEFTPMPEEIAAKAGHEADAWRPLEALIDRATSAGLDVIRWRP